MDELVWSGSATESSSDEEQNMHLDQLASAAMDAPKVKAKKRKARKQKKKKEEGPTKRKRSRSATKRADTNTSQNKKARKPKAKTPPGQRRKTCHFCGHKYSDDLVNNTTELGVGNKTCSNLYCDKISSHASFICATCIQRQQKYFASKDIDVKNVFGDLASDYWFCLDCVLHDFPKVNFGTCCCSYRRQKLECPLHADEPHNSPLHCHTYRRRNPPKLTKCTDIIDVHKMRVPELSDICEYEKQRYRTLRPSEDAKLLLELSGVPGSVQQQKQESSTLKSVNRMKAGYNRRTCHFCGKEPRGGDDAPNYHCSNVYCDKGSGQAQFMCHACVQKQTTYFKNLGIDIRNVFGDYDDTKSWFCLDCCKIPEFPQVPLGSCCCSFRRSQFKCPIHPVQEPSKRIHCHSYYQRLPKNRPVLQDVSVALDVFRMSVPTVHEVSSSQKRLYPHLPTPTEVKTSEFVGRMPQPDRNQTNPALSKRGWGLYPYPCGNGGVNRDNRLRTFSTTPFSSIIQVGAVRSSQDTTESYVDNKISTPSPCLMLDVLGIAGFVDTEDPDLITEWSSIKQAPALPTSTTDVMTEVTLTDIPLLIQERHPHVLHFIGGASDGEDTSSAVIQIYNSGVNRWINIRHTNEDAFVDAVCRGVTPPMSTGLQLQIPQVSSVLTPPALLRTPSGAMLPDYGLDQTPLNQSLRNFTSSVECVFLNACCTSGLAEKLVLSGIQNVVCWNSTTFGPARACFAEAFYKTLAARRDRDYAFAFEKAKQALADAGYVEGNPDDYYLGFNEGCHCWSRVVHGVPHFLSTSALPVPVPVPPSNLGVPQISTDSFGFTFH